MSRVGGVVFVLCVSSQHQQHVSLFSVTLVVVYGVNEMRVQFPGYGAIGEGSHALMA